MRVQEGITSSSAQQIETGYTHVLKHRNLFATFDEEGFIPCGQISDCGLFAGSTRHLDCYQWNFANQENFKPLSADISDDGTILVCDAEILTGESGSESSIFLHREILLFDSDLHEKCTFRNYSDKEEIVRFTVRWGSDFSDIYEIRCGGTLVEREDRITIGDIDVSYTDARQHAYTTQIDIRGGVCCDYQSGEARIAISVPAHGKAVFSIRFSCSNQGPEAVSRVVPPAFHFAEARSSLRSRTKAFLAQTIPVRTLGYDEDAWLRKSWSDLLMLLTRTNHGMVPYAGVPWFSTLFGRDSLWTSFFMLDVAPTVAEGTLRRLAAYQATSEDQATESMKGKILHEMRDGELVRLGLNPYGLYFGAVDSTPLFIWLLGQYIRRVESRNLLHELRPAFEAALAYLLDGLERDTFLSYENRGQEGLHHQGWKDADDAIFDEQGEVMRGRIALIEAQAYAFGALQEAALLHDDPRTVERCQQAAQKLQEEFLKQFWQDDLGAGGYLAMAVADGEVSRVISSTALHALLFDILPPKYREKAVFTLNAANLESGWGLRTVAPESALYHPLSYHNGSVWPHDNAIIIAGLLQAGFTSEAARLSEQLMAAARAFSYRLPELYAGVERMGSAPSPVRYRNACAPQAWAASAVFKILPALHPETRDIQQNLDPDKQWISGMQTNLKT